MAVLLSIADGNINATASWGVVEPTSFQGTPNVSLAFTTLTSLYTGTSFVLASAVTLSGVALQLSGRVTAPTGTLNVQLYDVTGATIAGQVTVNISDLPNSNGVTSNHIDWTYFKFASNVTTIAGRTYAIRAQASVASQLSWYYTTASANVNRALVTTTTQAPVTSDQLIVAGSYTSAGVNSTTTITMNYSGSSYVVLGNLWISSKGILTFSTNIGAYLPMSGYIVVGIGGTFNIGTSLSPISGSAEIQMNCTTALQYPILVYGTMNTYGQSKLISAKLVGDVIVGATSSTTSVVTGWKSGDIILLPSTTRTYTQFETVTLIANATGTTLTHAGYIYAHDGNSSTKVQADIVNLTRNIIIRGNGAPLANKTNIQMFANSITSFYYTSFIGLGTGITVANSGICVNILNSGYTFEMQYCLINDNGQAVANTVNTALFNQNTIGTIVSNNVFFGLGWTTTTVSTIICTNFDDGNFVIACLATTQVLLATNTGSNNTFSSNNTPATTGFFNGASNNSFYSNNTIGLNISNPTSLTNTNLSNFRIWRNNTYGINLTFTSTYNRNNIISFDSLYCFGNTTASIQITTKLQNKVYFSNSYFYGGTTLVQPTHFSIPNNTFVDSIYYNNCYFGYSDSSLTLSPFSTAILQAPNLIESKVFNNCYFNGTEMIQTAGYSNINYFSTFISLNHNGMLNSNRQWLPNGTIYSDGQYVGSTSSQVYSPNLVKWTDNMKKSNWSKSTFDTITLFQLAPDGSYTAVLIDETGASADPNTFSQNNIAATSNTITYSIYTKKGTATTRNFLLRNATTLTNFDNLTFNYSSTGNLGNGWTSTDIGSGWFRLSYTRSTGISIGDLLVIYCGRTGTAGVGSTATWYLWGPQVNAGSIALPYQKVNDVVFDKFTSLGKSLRLVPNSTTNKLTTPLVRVPVKSGTNCTISVDVRESSALGSDVTYTGNPPRLVYTFNPILGNFDETIGATFSKNNLVTYPQDFSNAYWVKNNTSVILNQDTAPNGNLTATKFIVNNGFSFSLTVSNICSTPFTAEIGEIYTFSVYVKKEVLDRVTIAIANTSILNTPAFVTVNLNNGTLISSGLLYGSPGYTITNKGNGWYRVSVTKIITTTVNNRVGITPGSSTLSSGNGTAGIYIWGAQLELGTQASTYQPDEDWLKLTYTTGTFSNDGVAEFYVDCDGTTGWINVDNWVVDTSVDSRKNDYWSVNSTYVEPDFKRGTRTSTFIN